ncbi:hypothetical protein E0H26_19785 [Micromonospora zingiberis]|uniref:NAD(+)--protein-arginine ADP-ribosyltransferase n=1 Tax=Micromonospora zingiberis TaxID=2053011 RepID=A0A4R0GEL5_9ACTN|nr:hypothetical protein [Micromonospora zingiberis]TCB95436.1 hypothetical protein E0H26_19785 [Micromonospora zingiberis]
MPIRAMAAALPAEAGRCAVLSAPSVTARPALFEVLREALTEHLGGAAGGVRLVPLGAYAPAVVPGTQASILAEWIGQEVAVPLTALAVPADVVLEPVVWLVCTPDGNIRAEALWPMPTPVPAAVTVTGHWPRALLHTNGGFVDLPPWPARRAWVPRRPQPRARPDNAVKAAAVPETAPGIRTPAGWSFLDEPGLGGGPVLAGFVVEVGVTVTGFRVSGRPVAPRGLAKLLATVRAGDPRPLVLVTSGVSVHGNAADLLFGRLADALASTVYVAGGEVTRTATGLLRTTGTFLRWHGRRPGGPRESRRGQVVGSVLPPRPAPRLRPAVAGPAWTLPPAPAPAQVRPTAPTASATPVSADLAALLAPGRWTIAYPVVPAPADALPPELPSVPPEAAPAATPDAEPAGLPSAGEPEPAVATGSPPAELPPTPSADPAPPPPGPEPRWLTGDDPTVVDRTALRQALGSRYDAHARVVARTLAQAPGLRAMAGAAGDLAAGLVAVRAYCEDEREVLNEFLRGGGPESEADRLRVVARSAAYGLRRLPSVLGPVLQYGPSGTWPAAGYRQGDVLVEPAFMDVSLSTGAGAASTAPRFVVWSVSARRLDGLDTGSRAVAIFPPGSRFQVLAVEEETPDQAARVLLWDLAAAGRGRQDGAERILERLRGAEQRGTPVVNHLPPLAFAPGLDDAGRPFPLPAGAGAVTS